MHALCLKNAGTTFQRLMRIALGAQMGRNAEAYVDDIMVKSREGDNLLRDLDETFANLRKVNIKLNPAKCVLGYHQENSSVSSSPTAA